MNIYGLMLQFLASKTINIPTITSNKHALYGVNGDVTGVTGGLPLRDQMPNLSPQWLILHWIGQKLTRPKSLTLNDTTS